MRELTISELDAVNGGGLTFVELLLYTASFVAAGSVAGALVAAASIAIIEYQDYKDGV